MHKKIQKIKVEITKLKSLNCNTLNLKTDCCANIIEWKKEWVFISMVFFYTMHQFAIIALFQYVCMYVSVFVCSICR